MKRQMLILATVVMSSATIGSAEASQRYYNAYRGGYSPGARVSLNPQPLPPRIYSPGSRVSLNPQPLPPRIYGPMRRYR